MSRTTRELLVEALAHFDAATDYAERDDGEKRVRETVTGDLPEAVQAIRAEIAATPDRP